MNDVEKIIGYEVAPISVASQDIIDEFGQIVDKSRHTHDQ